MRIPNNSGNKHKTGKKMSLCNNHSKMSTRKIKPKETQWTLKYASNFETIECQSSIGLWLSTNFLLFMRLVGAKIFSFWRFPTDYSKKYSIETRETFIFLLFRFAAVNEIAYIRPPHRKRSKFCHTSSGVYGGLFFLDVAYSSFLSKTSRNFSGSGNEKK